MAAGGALEDKLAPRTTLPPLARRGSAPADFFARLLIPAPLVSDHREIHRHFLRLAECVSGQTRARKKTLAMSAQRPSAVFSLLGGSSRPRFLASDPSTPSAANPHTYTQERSENPGAGPGDGTKNPTP